MASVAVTLFGGFGIRIDGAARELPGQKDRALLAVLALSPGETHSRERLATFLWSDRDERHARDSLKHALARLRTVLGASDGGPLGGDRLSTRLESGAVTVDVVEFERLIADRTPETLEAALALYRGDLLDGISVRDPVFEDWLRDERARLRSSAEDAAANLMEGWLVDGAWDRAADAARRLIRLDPFREDACRALMRHHVDRGCERLALVRLRFRRHRGSPQPDAPSSPAAERLAGDGGGRAGPRKGAMPWQPRYPTGHRSPFSRSKT